MAGSERLKELVAGYGTIEQSAGVLIEDGEGFIDPLDVLRGSDGSVGIGRGGVYGKVGESIAEAFKVESRSDGAVADGECRLDYGVAGTAATTGSAFVASRDWPLRIPWTVMVPAPAP